MLFFNTERRYLQYSMGPGRGGIHISWMLRPVAVARIQSFQNVFCRLGLFRRRKKDEMEHDPVTNVTTAAF